MPSLEHVMPLSRPRDKGRKPLRRGSHPDKHHRTARSGWVKAKKTGADNTSKRENAPTRDGQCVIDGVTYQYEDLPYSAINFEGKPPEQVIREMSPEKRERFEVVALVPSAAVEVLEGVRREILTALTEEESDTDGDLTHGDKPKLPSVKRKLAPNTLPAPTLEELREELLNLLVRAREKAMQTKIVQRRVRGRKRERMEVVRKGSLPRAERIRLRSLKSEYRTRLSEAGVLLPPAMGSEAWFERLEKEKRLAA